MNLRKIWKDMITYWRVLWKIKQWIYYGILISELFMLLNTSTHTNTQEKEKMLDINIAIDIADWYCCSRRQKNWRETKGEKWKLFHSKEGIEENLGYVSCEFVNDCNRSNQKHHIDHRWPGMTFCLRELEDKMLHLEITKVMIITIIRNYNSM